MLENEGEYKHAKRRDGGTGEVDNTNRGREGGRARKREEEGGREGELNMAGSLPCGWIV